MRTFGKKAAAAPARAPSTTASQPPSGPPGNGLMYVKCRFVGFQGVKHVVFVPDSMTWTNKSVETLMQTLKLERPNLVLSMFSSSHEASFMLTEEELARPEIQELVEEGATVEDRNMVVRQVLAAKMRGIANAVMSALDQTKSWPLVDCEGDCFKQQVSEIDQAGQFKSPFLVCDHTRNASFISSGDTHEAFKQMFASSVLMSEAAVEGAVPVDIDFHWLVEAGETVKSYTGNFFTDPEGNPLPEKHPYGQFWCDGDIYLLGYTHSSTGLDLSPKIGAQCNFDRSMVAPVGEMYVGCRVRRIAVDIIDCMQKGIPCLLVNRTGGVTSIMSEIVNIIVLAIADKGQWRSRFAKDQAALGDLTVIGRIQALSAVKMLAHALTVSGQQSLSGHGPITLADISHCLDIAVARHQVFIDTIKVVDPLLHTPEQCLEILSGCFSSTYVGIQELGASSAQVDVLMGAWNKHRTMERKAATLRRLDLVLSYLGAILAWVAILSATSLDVGKTCGVHEETEGESEGAAVMRFCSVLGVRTTQKVLEILTIGVPAAGALLVTMSARFQFKTKWAATKLAAAQIVRHIYLFRGAVGPYSLSWLSEGEEEFSQSAAAKMARMSFVSKVSAITDSVLSLDSLSLDASDTLLQENVAEHIQTTVLGLKRVRQAEGDAAAAGAADTTDPLLMEEDRDSKSKDADDGVSATTAEVYYKLRVRQLLEYYSSVVPQLTCQSDLLRFVIFVLGFAASMLGAMRISSWIPVTVGFASMLEVLALCHNLTARIMVTNTAISQLSSLEMQWNGLSNMDRRTPKFKALLMVATEQLAISVTEALVNRTSGTTDLEQEKDQRQDKSSGGQGSKNSSMKDKKQEK